MPFRTVHGTVLATIPYAVLAALALSACGQEDACYDYQDACTVTCPDYSTHPFTGPNHRCEQPGWSGGSYSCDGGTTPQALCGLTLADPWASCTCAWVRTDRTCHCPSYGPPVH
jgi:hypothetical protein